MDRGSCDLGRAIIASPRPPYSVHSSFSSSRERTIPERRVFPTSLLSKNHPIRHHVAQKKKLTRNSGSPSPYTQKKFSATAPETQVNALSLASAIEQQVTSDGASLARSPYRPKKKTICILDWVFMWE